MTAVAPKNPLTSSHVRLRARRYQSASSYVLDLSQEALATTVILMNNWYQITAGKIMSTVTNTSPYITVSDP